jgi:hypothetical protein
MRFFVLLSLFALMVGCAPAAPETDAHAAPPKVESTPAPLACAKDADCVVKNVGNCCGYYPACVHVDQTVDPDAVARRCAETGQAGICGFDEISACACVDAQCVAAPHAAQ